MAIDADGVIDFVDGEEEFIAETSQSIKIPKELPSPTLPSKAVVEHHNLTYPVQELVPDMRCSKTKEQCPSFQPR